MRSEGQIRHQLGQVRFRHLKRELRTGLSRKPENCAHNVSVEDTVRVRLCVLPEPGYEYTVCDPNHGGVDRCSRCPHFELTNDKESVKDGFNEFLDTATRAEVAERYPDVAALLWVLDDPSPTYSVPESPTPARHVKLWVPGPSLMTEETPGLRNLQWTVDYDGNYAWILRH